MTVQLAYQQLLLQLLSIYEQREAANIADWVIEHITGLKKIDRIIYKQLSLNDAQQDRLKEALNQLLQHKPVQYVLGEAWFAGMRLFVNEHVLIPRPETEELVQWILKNEKCKMKNAKLSILDIGTGSGCIPIALKKHLPAAEICAIDVSEGALHVSKRNAEEQQVSVEFIHLNFLKREERDKLNKFDVIVSNPPYIKQSEEQSMQKNVLDHEPHVALFVPDDDALIFYTHIAHFAKDHLAKEGCIFLEINEALGSEVGQLFKEEGYKNIEVRKDMQGKDRMIKIENDQ